MKNFKRFLVISSILGLLCLKPVTDIMPEPMKGAFSNVRENVLVVASGEGIGVPDVRIPRGAFENKNPGAIQHVGGR